MRFSLTELAARAAAVRLAGASRAPLTQAGAEATAARVVFDALGADELEYFVPGRLHARLSQGARADASRAAPRSDRTRPLDGLQRRSGSAPAGFAGGPRYRAPACSCRRTNGPCRRSATAPRCFTSQQKPAAPGRCDGRDSRLCCSTFRSTRERSGSLRRHSSRAPPTRCATVPQGDECAREAWAGLGVTVEAVADPAEGTSDLASLRRYVFTLDRPPERERSGDVRLFSAPGEGREAVEIVRRVLDEAARGVPFDEMAVFLRTPQQYLGLLEHACARGGVPVYFDRGTRRPDPAGRAFIALLSCAVEGLSAKRFDEYLSLGQVPRSRSRCRGSAADDRPTTLPETVRRTGRPVRTGPPGAAGRGIRRASGGRW